MRVSSVLGRLVLAASLLMPGIPAGAEGFIFRHKLAPIEASMPSSPEVPGSPEEPEPPAAPEEDEAPVYYRVVVESFHGPGSVAEVALVSGPEFIPPKEAAIAGGESPEAFDGNPSTGWTGDGGSADIVYGIAKGSMPDALEITALDIDGPASFYIEKSSNGLSWTPIVSYVGEPEWGPGEKRRYPFNPAYTGGGGEGHKFWRVAVEKFNGSALNYNGISEIVFRNGSGADVTVGGSRYSDDTRGYLPDAVFDKTGSGWNSPYRENYPVSFWYEFPEPQAISSVDIQANVNYGAPQRFRIESSDDGRAWSVEAFYIGQGAWEINETRNYPVPNLEYPDGYHSYWRISIHSMHGTSIVGLNELEFIGEGGAYIHSRSVPIASSERHIVSGVKYVFDGKNGNQWQPASNDANPWVGYVFPQPVKAETVAVWSDYNTGPRSFTVEWSDDGVTWTKGATHSGNGTWGNYERREFPVHPKSYPAGHYRFWRVFVEKTAAHEQTKVSVRELFIRDGSGNDLTGKGVPISGTFDGNAAAPKMAFDGIWNDGYNYFWRSAGVPDWIGYEFPEPVRPATVAMIANGNNAPRDFRIEYSADGNNWTATSRHSGNGTWVADERSFDVFAPPLSGPGHQFWRILVHEVNSGNTVRIREMDFLASDLVDRQTHGDPIASYDYGIFDAVDAFDGVETGYNYWEAPVPNSIGYAFPFRVDVREVHIQAFQSSSAVRDFDIQWSDDEINWTTVADYRGAGNWTPGEWRVFPIPKPEPGPDEAYVYELEFLRGGDVAGSMGIRSLVLLEDRFDPFPHGKKLAWEDFKGVILDEDRNKTSLKYDNAYHWYPGAEVNELTLRFEFAEATRIEGFNADVHRGSTGSVVGRLYRVTGSGRDLVDERRWDPPPPSSEPG